MPRKSSRAAVTLDQEAIGHFAAGWADLHRALAMFAAHEHEPDGAFVDEANEALGRAVRELYFVEAALDLHPKTQKEAGDAT